jgi:cephalosporin hydroxylase
VGDLGFGHKNTWMGVPIIRLPEDILLQQEIIWKEKPDLVIEVGVARGGGLVLNASLQAMAGIPPRVLGVDNKIFQHTRDSIESNPYSSAITLLEGDSVSQTIVDQVADFTSGSKKALLVLDSDHSSDHVYKELSSYAPLLSAGSVVIVCDTLIDELPPGTYQNRTWSNGKGPLDAVQKFLDKNDDFEPFMSDDTRSLILTEIRDGIIRKVGL